VLIATTLRRAAASPTMPTPRLVDLVLRDEPPVASTRRIAPARTGGTDDRDRVDGGPLGDRRLDELQLDDREPVELRLDGPDREAREGAPPRNLAFGSGARRCPASVHAVAIATAVVDVLREPSC